MHPWETLANPEIYVCMYVCMYVHMYVSKLERRKPAYIQPGAQGCRGGLALAWGSGLPPQSAELDALCTYVHMYVPKLEMASWSFPPYITFMYVCMHVGTPEGGLPPRTPGVPCTPEDFGSSCYVYVNM